MVVLPKQKGDYMKACFMLNIISLMTLVDADSIIQKSNKVKRSVFDLISNAGHTPNIENKETFYDKHNIQINIVGDKFKPMKYEDLRNMFIKKEKDKLNRIKRKEDLKNLFQKESRKNRLNDKKKETINVRFSFLTKI